MILDVTNNYKEQQEPNMTPQGITIVTDWLFLGGEDDVDQILSEIDIWIDFRHFGKWNRVIFIPDKVTYIRMPFVDGDSSKVKGVLTNAKLLIDSFNKKKNVLISCHAGFSRSALLAVWYLAEEMGSFDNAWLEMKNRRSLIEFHDGFDGFVQELREQLNINE